ncbi:hypothetical protein EDD16DRAFT_1640611 [Pisolithus croceorrhizus]
MSLSHLWWMSLILLGSFPCVAATSNALNKLKSVIEGIISEPRKLAIVVVCASVVVIAILIWLILTIARYMRKRRLRKSDGRRRVSPQSPSNDASISELEAARATTKVLSPTPSSNPPSRTSLKLPPGDTVATFNVGLPARLPSPQLSKRTSRASQIPDREPYRRPSRGRDNRRREVSYLPSLNIPLEGRRLPSSERRGPLAADEQNPSSDAALIACQGGPRRARPSVHWVSQGRSESRGRHRSNSTHRGQQSPIRDVEAVVLSHPITYPSKRVRSHSEQRPQDRVAGVSVMHRQAAVSRSLTDRNRQHANRVKLPDRYRRPSHPTLPLDDRLPLYAAK